MNHLPFFLTLSLQFWSLSEEWTRVVVLDVVVVVMQRDRITWAVEIEVLVEQRVENNNADWKSTRRRVDSAIMDLFDLVMGREDLLGSRRVL